VVIDRSPCQELLADRRQVVPDGLADDPAVLDLEQPEDAIAQPAAATVDVEGTAGQATGPDVFVDHEAPAVAAADREVDFVDSGREELAVALPNSFESLDRAVGQADDFVHDARGHRGEDPVDIAVVFRTELPVDEPIKVGAVVRIEVVELRHPTTIGPRADETLMAGPTIAHLE